jgi:hypothetical protein
MLRLYIHIPWLASGQQQTGVDAKVKCASLSRGSGNNFFDAYFVFVQMVIYILQMYTIQLYV